MKNYILFIFILLFFSCADKLSITINNNSGTDFTMETSENTSEISIQNKTSKEIVIDNIASNMSITFASSLYTNSHEFSDVDHWFGVTHNITVNIEKDGITIDGTRNERFNINE